MIAIDTNVLVRHLTEDDPAQMRVARTFLGSLSESDPGFVSTLVLAEPSWVLRRGHGRLPDHTLHDIIEGLLDASTIEVEDEESVNRALHAARAGADFADALIAETADLYGCTETVTFDRRAADRLGWRPLTAR